MGENVLGRSRSADPPIPGAAEGSLRKRLARLLEPLEAHVGEPVRLLIADDHVRVVGEGGPLLRELNNDSADDYQPQLHSSPMS